LSAATSIEASIPTRSFGNSPASTLLITRQADFSEIRRQDGGQKLPSARYCAGQAPNNPSPTVKTCTYRLSRKSRSLGRSFLHPCWSPRFSSFLFLYLGSLGAGSSVQFSWLAPALHI